MCPRSLLPARDRAARSRLVQLLAAGRPLARASLVTMARVCGKKNCRCALGRKHVSLYLSTRVGRARKMLYVPPELEALARELVENARSAEALVEEMSQASLENLAEKKTRLGARKASRTASETPRGAKAPAPSQDNPQPDRSPRK